MNFLFKIQTWYSILNADRTTFDTKFLYCLWLRTEAFPIIVQDFKFVHAAWKSIHLNSLRFGWIVRRKRVNKDEKKIA